MYGIKLTQVLAVLSFAALGIEAAKNSFTCQATPGLKLNDTWVSMQDSCVQKLTEQVQIELDAAMTYLSMGAHFSRDRVNRPGFAKLFFESASEERQHAIHILGYLLMRGELTADKAGSGGSTKEVNEVNINPAPILVPFATGSQALRSALELETKVTQDIRSIIETCEGSSKVTNDYHLVDYLTGEFLEEQYRGQRALAGHASTLGKLMVAHGDIGEFLYDKMLLNQE